MQTYKGINLSLTLVFFLCWSNHSFPPIAKPKPNCGFAKMESRAVRTQKNRIRHAGSSIIVPHDMVRAPFMEPVICICSFLFLPCFATCIAMSQSSVTLFSTSVTPLCELHGESEVKKSVKKWFVCSYLNL